MKTLKVFSAFALFSILFISCTQNNAGAVYYSNNSLSEKIIISATSQSGNMFTSKNVSLRLASSPFFREHLTNLELIDVIRVSYRVSDASIDLSSATIKIGDKVLPNFEMNSENTIEVNDATLITAIASTLQQDGEILFSFENNFASQVDLEIDVFIDVRGTFVN